MNFNLMKQFLYKTGDNQFYNAIKITFCAVSSFLYFYNQHQTALAFSVTLGAILCSPIDIDSSLRNKIISVGTAAVIIPLVSIIFTLLYKHTFVFYLFFIAFVFLASFISLYGQRANKFSFTLLLGMSLSFIHITNTTDGALTTGLYMFFGGLFYLTVSVIFYLIMPSRYINLELANCIDLIAKYLKIKAKVWDTNANLEDLRAQRSILQTSINESLKEINKYLEINKVKTIDASNTTKVIITVSFLNEILRLAETISFKKLEITENLNKEGDLKLINQLTNNFSTILSNISNNLKVHHKYTSQLSLNNQLADLQLKIGDYIKKNPNDEAYINDTFTYLSKQVDQINGLEYLYVKGINPNEIPINKQKNVTPILKPKQYQISTLVNNLNFKSTYFRYSLRFTLAMLIGLMIGNLIEAKKEYWILLTIVVIMRPGYGLTKSRTNQRVIGTVIGGVIGILILFFIKDTFILSILAITAMLLGYWYTSSDYRIGVTFITLFIILIYGILKTGADISVVYRITDTLICAFIALLANSFLWPSWEYNSIKYNLKNTLNSTILYLDQINNNYFNKNKKAIINIDTRQNAFIETGNLMAAYQRLVQEPKNKQNNRAEIYQIIVLNQTLVGAIASLDSYLEANKIDLQSYNYIINNTLTELNLSLDLIDPKLNLDYITNSSKESKTIIKNDNDSINHNDQESLIINQLKWIQNLAVQIDNSTNKMIHNK